MSTFNHFDQFVENLCEGVHDLTNDQLVVALVADANTPSLTTDTQLTDLTQISYTNCSTRNITTSSGSQTSGTYTLALTDLTLTASGGNVGPFRYVVVYDDTASNDELIGMIDYGADITLADTDTFLIDFAAATLTLG